MCGRTGKMSCLALTTDIVNDEEKKSMKVFTGKELARQVAYICDD